MTPAARVQAAIEVLDEVIVSARDDGPPADTIVSRYFKTRRYAGSKDRRAVRELVFRAVRAVGERPATGRAAMLALVQQDPALADLFGEVRGPESLVDGEAAAEGGLLPAWLQGELSPPISSEEWPALLERAPLDIRVNAARASRDDLLAQFEGAEPTRLSPWGIRLASETRLDEHPAFLEGLIEVQDEGSQLIAFA